MFPSQHVIDVVIVLLLPPVLLFVVFLRKPKRSYLRVENLRQQLRRVVPQCGGVHQVQ
jgi:hypothetical protein